MPRNDNYPDDIRMYDNDPRSPFYDNSADEAMEDAAQEKADQYWAEYLATGRIDDLDLETADLKILAQEQNIGFEQIIYNECAELVRVEMATKDE